MHLLSPNPKYGIQGSNSPSSYLCCKEFCTWKDEPRREQPPLPRSAGQLLSESLGKEMVTTSPAILQAEFLSPESIQWLDYNTWQLFCSDIPNFIQQVQVQ